VRLCVIELFDSPYITQEKSASFNVIYALPMIPKVATNLFISIKENVNFSRSIRSHFLANEVSIGEKLMSNFFHGIGNT